MTQSSENKQTIMVVEDNDFVRMQIVSYLQDAEWSVEECENAEVALQKINESVSAIVADIRMEPIDGFEFVKNLRSQDNLTPVVLVTGDDDPDMLNEAGRWGVFAVLRKPVERDRLTGTVERALKVGRR